VHEAYTVHTHFDQVTLKPKVSVSYSFEEVCGNIFQLSLNHVTTT